MHHKNIHDDSVTSASFVIKGEMDLQKLNLWLGALLEMRGEDIYRMKGILNIKFNKERFVFQVSFCTYCCEWQATTLIDRIYCSLAVWGKCAVLQPTKALAGTCS